MAHPYALSGKYAARRRVFGLDDVHVTGFVMEDYL